MKAARIQQYNKPLVDDVAARAVKPDQAGFATVNPSTGEEIEAFSYFTPAQIEKVSSPREFHPEALSEPYVNLSAHTAPAMGPRRTPICQWANKLGSRQEIRATQCVALRRCPRSFLYFRLAHRASARSS